MSIAISENTRSNLFHSLAAVKGAAPAIIAGMTTGLAGADAEPAPYRRARAAATLLVEMLIEQAHHLIEQGAPQDIAGIALSHRSQGISGRHYSGFGDALMPVLKDTLGARLPSAVAAAWCDAFWLVIRLVLGQPQARQDHVKPSPSSSNLAPATIISA